MGAVIAPVCARGVFGEGVVLVEGEGVASVVDSEGEGVTVVAGGVEVDGAGGVGRLSLERSPQPTVSIAILCSAVIPLTSALLLKTFPAFAFSGTLSTV